VALEGPHGAAQAILRSRRPLNTIEESHSTTPSNLVPKSIRQETGDDCRGHRFGQASLAQARQRSGRQQHGNIGDWKSGLSDQHRNEQKRDTVI